MLDKEATSRDDLFDSFSNVSRSRAPSMMADCHVTSQSINLSLVISLNAST